MPKNPKKSTNNSFLEIARVAYSATQAEVNRTNHTSAVQEAESSIATNGQLY